MSQILVEENNIYALDCTKAVWASGEMHQRYHAAGLSILRDADFVVETEDEILIIEYKNANIPGAAKPEAFHPLEEKRVTGVAKKYYDSLPYLTLLQKAGPKRFIFIVEAHNSDSTMRKRLKDRLASLLPFELQKALGTGVRLIEGVDVLSIEEWNSHAKYGNYPLLPL